MPLIASVKKSIAFIEDNLHKDIGVRDVADSVSYSQFYFSREFSKYTHISIYDYIVRRKISESYKYLFKAKPKIVDLAFLYGFQSHEVYTRAFRKVFAESPSEAAVYKPMAVYEPIDDEYLAFLHGLRVDLIDKPAAGCFFEADSSTGLESGSDSLLALLSRDHLLRCSGVLGGSVEAKETRFLSFRINGLTHKVRIYHTDAKRVFRYFTDNHYDVNEMSSNFILMKREKDYIDVYIPDRGHVIAP